METLAFVIIALFILIFGLISGRLQQTVVTPPMVFVLVGVLLSPQLFGVLVLDVEGELIRVLAELTLVLVLFTDASRIDLRILRREHNIPIRMLIIGLPLTIILGGLFAAGLFQQLTFWEAMIVGAILAPTDAALGQAVVSSPRVPIRIRQALNIESGLNDGITVPIITLLIALASATEAVAPVDFWIRFAALQIIFGPIVGILVGYVGGQLVQRASETGWMNESFKQLSALALALLAFATAELIGGNGFIAAFCAGLTLGNTTSQTVCGSLYEFAEAEGQLLTLLVFLIFGAVMVLPALAVIDAITVLYVFLSLTIVRMVPVAISLVGMRLRLPTYLFLGWFGPRGIASVLFGLILLERSAIAGREEIFEIVVITIVFSVFAHGLTAVPGTHWYGAHGERMRDQDDIEELQSVTAMPLRLSFTRKRKAPDAH